MTTTKTTIALWIGLAMTAAAGCADDGTRGDGAGDPPAPGTSEKAAGLAASSVTYAPHNGLTGTDVQAALDQAGAGLQAAAAANDALAPVARSGAYADLTGTPDLGSFATAAQLAGYATLGELGAYATTASLARVATTGSYADLAGKPALAAVATSGQYADLAGTPALAAVATSGQYADLAGTPDLSVLVTADRLPWQDNGSYAYAAIAGDEATIADASWSTSNDCGTSTQTVLAQSFTAQQSGPMKSAIIYLTRAVAGVTFEIRQGDGTGGALLYQTTVDLGPQSAPVSVTGVELVAGQMYTIVYSRPSTQWELTCGGGNPYPGGTFSNEGGAVPFIDIGFAVFLGNRPVAITPGGKLGIGTTAPTAPIDVAGNAIRVRESSSPASNAACAKGELRWDASFVYVCVATNQWRRAALAAY